MRSTAFVLPRLGSLLCLTLAACGSPEASRLKDDVFPVGGFGKLVVQGPQISDMERYSISVERPGMSNTLLQLGHPVNLESRKDYCVRITSYGSAAATKKCGVEIVANRTTELETGSVKLWWNRDIVAVAVGPRPTFLVEAEDQTIGVSRTDMSFRDPPNDEYLFFAGRLTARLAEVGILAEDRLFVDLKPRDHTIFDLTPPDRRVQVTFKVQHARFPVVGGETVSGYYVANFALLSHVADSVAGFPNDFERRSSEFFSSRDPRGKFFSWLSVPIRASDRPTELTYSLYPLTALDKGLYTLNVSGTQVALHFDPKNPAPLTYEIEPVNVEHINSTTPGFYRVYQVTANGDSRLGWWYISRGGYLSDDVTSPSLTSLGNFMPTQTTFYLLKGFNYRIDSYMYDDSRILVKQSSHDLDY